MNLLERLNKQIQRLIEKYGDWSITTVHNIDIEYVKNPSANELRNFAKENNELRAVRIKGDWYFWGALKAIHEDFVKSLNKMNQWDQELEKVELDRQGNLTLSTIEDYIYWQDEDFQNAINKTNFQSYEFEEAIRDFANLCKELNNKFGIRFASRVDFYLGKMLKGEHINPNKV